MSARQARLSVAHRGDRQLGERFDHRAMDRSAIAFHVGHGSRLVRMDQNRGRDEPNQPPSQHTSDARQPEPVVHLRTGRDAELFDVRGTRRVGPRA